ncbi:MAG: AraC family transcriptional regulator, partial [Pseudomonadales bacterium]|nr:AraC family transcriptional regulator [Pseudomonadales bacterium]
MLQGAREAGADVDQLLRDLAIDATQLEKASARISYRQHTDLVKALRDTLQDEMLGLLDRPVKPNTLKMLTYSAINARTIGGAIEIWAEAAVLLDVGLDIRWQRGNEQSLLIIERRANNRVKNQHAIEYLLFAAHRVFCWFADQLLPLASVELDYSKPGYAEEYRRLFVGAPISYNCERCSLAFRQSVLSLPNVRDFNML